MQLVLQGKYAYVCRYSFVVSSVLTLVRGVATPASIVSTDPLRRVLDRLPHRLMLAEHTPQTAHAVENG